MLVVDEGHRLKNTSGSQIRTALNWMEAEARILITGTPVQVGGRSLSWPGSLCLRTTGFASDLLLRRALAKLILLFQNILSEFYNVANSRCPASSAIYPPSAASTNAPCRRPTP